jgi:hypothetical protein
MMGCSKTVEHDGSLLPAEGIASDPASNASLKGMLDGE